MPISEVSMRSLRQFAGGRLELLFSLSCEPDEDLIESQDGLDGGQDIKVLVQTVEQLDDPNAGKE